MDDVKEDPHSPQAANEANHSEITDKVQEYYGIVRNLKETRAPFASAIENSINWAVAISLGSLLWIMGNFDKFRINGIFFNRDLFSIILALIGVSAISFIFLRSLLYISDVKQGAYLYGLSAIPKLIDIDEKMGKFDGDTVIRCYSESEFDRKDSSKFYSKWFGKRGDYIIMIGMVSYCLGILFSVIYTTLFLYNTGGIRIYHIIMWQW